MKKKKFLFIQDVKDKIFKIIEKNKNKIKIKILFFLISLEKKSKLKKLILKNQNNTYIIPCYQDNEITIKKIIF